MDLPFSNAGAWNKKELITLYPVGGETNKCGQ